MSITHSPEFLKKRKFFMVLPGFAVPILFFIFYSLKGGTGAPDKGQGGGIGFNTTLPMAKFDKQKPERNKLELYKQADRDSLRWKEYQRQDPYFRKGSDTVHRQVGPTEDSRAAELLQRLDRLKESIRQPAPYPAPTVIEPHPSFMPVPRIDHRPVVEESVDTPEIDPQLEKLNGMLDKILRIQHPVEVIPTTAEAAPAATMPDSAVANSLPAVTAEDQVLVAGATIALRMTEAAKINGVSFPRDQLVYGVVSISNDRMLITVNSIRREQSIFSTALQVYDLDGLPGIHIPGSLGRETAKQSVDQSINSMGVTGLDGSPAAQVTNAGVLAAKSLLSRKVRLLRVTVHAGYQVLLRNTKSPGRIQVARQEASPDSVSVAPDPAGFDPFLHRVVHHEKMEMVLQGVFLKDSLLWIMLRLENHSPIGYAPEYVRWSIRDRRRAKRTAVQDIVVKPLFATPMEVLSGDSSRMMLVAFRPFALPRDKELVLQLAERNGARELVMSIGEKDLLKAKKVEE